MVGSTGRRAPFSNLKQIQVMSTIYLDLPVATDEEEDLLLDVLENFESDNATDALREYFGLRAERRESIPDFIDPTKL